MLSLPPELQLQVFLQCRSYDDAFNLQLSCQQLHAVFEHSKKTIQEHLNYTWIARQLLRYYKFLQRLKFDDNTIELPPPGGWRISPELWKRRGKSEHALAVVKTLPYLNVGPWSSVGYKSDACLPNCNENVGSNGCFEEVVMKGVYYDDDWTFEKEAEWDKAGSSKVRDEGEEKSGSDEEQAGAESKSDSEDEEEEDEDEGDDEIDEDDGSYLPLRLSNLVGMFMGHESGGEEVLLDTLNGTIYEEFVRMDSGDYGISLETYIDQKIASYTNLEWVFGPNDEPFKLEGDLDFEAIEAAGEPELEEDGWEDEWVAYLYHKHGWPGADYRKEECKEAISDFCNKDRS